MATAWLTARRRGSCPVLLCLALSIAPLSAHHALGMFDTREQVVVSGIVAGWAWSNPHVILEIDGAEADGGPRRWTVELAGPGALERTGWQRSDVRYRDRITALIHPLKSGAPGGLLISVTLADGRVLGNGGPPPAPR